MKYEIRLTTKAENDLRGIFEYIAFDLQSVQNAAGQLDRLEQGIASLDQMPERFRTYERTVVQPEPPCYAGGQLLGILHTEP